MKLFELLDTKALQKLPFDQLIKELVKRGYFKKELGRGGRGIAFEMHDGSVLKAWVNDPGYEDWIEFARKNPSTFYIKVLSEIKHFKAADREIKFIKLEKVEEFTHDKYAGHDLNGMLEDVCAYYNDVQYPPFDSPVEILKDLEVKPTIEWVKFVKAIGVVATHLLSSGMKLDLHSGNIGTRNGKDPVIFDALHAPTNRFKEVVDLEQVLKDKHEVS